VNDPKRYPAEVFFSEEDGGYIALARDLPGCSAFGKTQEKAIAELRHAIEAWQLAAKEAGNPIPEPSKQTFDALPSGKILLRLPRSLHATLIETAKREAVSLNQYLVSTLSASTAAGTLIAEISKQFSKFEGFVTTGPTGPKSFVTTGPKGFVTTGHHVGPGEALFVDIGFGKSHTALTGQNIDVENVFGKSTRVVVPMGHPAMPLLPIIDHEREA
jgi:antitoxin HicB